MGEQERPRLRCPLCQGERFEAEDGRLSMGGGAVEQRVALLVCRRCKYILPFRGRQSYFADGAG